MRPRRWTGAHGLVCPSGFSSTRRLEVVLVEPARDLLAEHRALHVGGAEVDAAPDAGIDDLLERVREAVEAPRRAGRREALVAGRREGDLVGAQEGLQRVHRRTADAGVT